MSWSLKLAHFPASTCLGASALAGGRVATVSSTRSSRLLSSRTSKHTRPSLLSHQRQSPRAVYFYSTGNASVPPSPGSGSSSSNTSADPNPASDSHRDPESIWTILSRQCKPTLASVSFVLLGAGVTYLVKSDSTQSKSEQAETVVPGVVADEGGVQEVGPGGRRVIGWDELREHRGMESAWIAVNGKIYDVTEFLPNHPGGAAIILANAGQDSSAAYARFHPPHFLSTILTPDNYIGDLDPTSIPKAELEETDEERRIRLAQERKLPLAAMINLNDFERVAKEVLTDVAWGYYSSFAEEGSSFNNNMSSYSRYEFRPRCLQKTEKAECSTSFFGIPTHIPIFVSPCAKVGLGHPEGEVSIARGAGKAGVIQVLSNLATNSPEDVAAVRQPGQTHFFQVYVHPKWEKSEADIKNAEQLGFKAIFLTVDTTHLGKREADMRASALAAGGDESQLGVARQMGSFYDENLGWDVVPWLKSVTKLPVVLKGIQCVEDVETAYEHGVAGVVLSNHGGRQLAYAPASIDILYELRQRRPDIIDNMEIYIDGGVRRGTDVVKALCLGAKGVGLGRPFLYANSAYGEDGVARVVSVMKDEVVRTMRLLGVSKVEDLKPELVTRRDI